MVAQIVAEVRAELNFRFPPHEAGGMEVKFVDAKDGGFQAPRWSTLACLMTIGALLGFVVIGRHAEHVVTGDADAVNDGPWPGLLLGLGLLRAVFF